MSKRKMDETLPRNRTARAKKQAGTVAKPVSPISTKTKEKPKEKVSKEDLVVFAFRLTEAERNLIHKAAGSGKASKYVRSLAVAAARGDENAVREILKGVTSPRV